MTRRALQIPTVEQALGSPEGMTEFLRAVKENIELSAGRGALEAKRPTVADLVAAGVPLYEAFNRGDIKLVADGSSTSTVINDVKVTTDSAIVLLPLDSTAATALAAGTLYILEADITEGRFVITHPASASQRTFRVLVFPRTPGVA